MSVPMSEGWRKVTFEPSTTDAEIALRMVPIYGSFGAFVAVHGNHRGDLMGSTNSKTGAWNMFCTARGIGVEQKNVG